MLYISTTGDLVALLSIIATLFYLLYSINSIYIKDARHVLYSRKTIIFSSLFIVFLHYLLAINAVFFQDVSLNDSSNFIFWANEYANINREVLTSIDFRYQGTVNSSSPPFSQTGYFFTVGASLYKQFLSLFALVLGTSSFFFSCLVISIFAISIIYFLKICVLLNIRVLSGWIIILFGGIPGFLLITILPYREIFMILFLMMFLYYGFKFRLGGKILYLTISVISLILFGLFHYATMAMVPFILLLVIFVPINTNFSLRKKIPIIVFISIALIGIILSGIDDYLLSNGQVGHVADLFRSETLYQGRTISGFIHKINNHLDVLRLVPGNGNYFWLLDSTSFLSLAKSFLQGMIYYMFKPFIWEVKSLSLLVLSLEGILRFTLIVFSIISIFKAENNKFRIFYILMLIIYFFIETIWALGTSNSGTASRHHIIAQWIVIMLGGAGMIEFIKYIISKSFDFLKGIIYKLDIPKKLTLGK